MFQLKFQAFCSDFRYREYGHEIKFETTMSGFSPCVPFTPFGGVGGRGGPPGGFNENPGPGPAPGPGFHHGPGPAGGGDLCTAPQPGAFGGFKNTYDNNPIGCLQERMQK